MSILYLVSYLLFGSPISTTSCFNSPLSIFLMIFSASDVIPLCPICPPLRFLLFSLPLYSLAFLHFWSVDGGSDELLLSLFNWLLSFEFSVSRTTIFFLSSLFSAFTSDNSVSKFFIFVLSCLRSTAKSALISRTSFFHDFFVSLTSCSVLSRRAMTSWSWRIISFS